MSSNFKKKTTVKLDLSTNVNDLYGWAMSQKLTLDNFSGSKINLMKIS